MKILWRFTPSTSTLSTYNTEFVWSGWIAIIPLAQWMRLCWATIETEEDIRYNEQHRPIVSKRWTRKDAHSQRCDSFMISRVDLNLASACYCYCCCNTDPNLTICLFYCSCSDPNLTAIYIVVVVVFCIVIYIIRAAIFPKEISPYFFHAVQNVRARIYSLVNPSLVL